MIRYTTGIVVSADGTKIGYRELGQGPKLILVHGGMMAAQNFMELGTLLSDKFTVYIPDRRGRGLSGEYGINYSLVKECEDLEALIHKTGAKNIFGLSSGAIIVLQAARSLSSNYKIALYEPPLPINSSAQSDWVKRYENQIAEGNLAAAMVTIIKGRGDPWSMIRLLPRFVLTPLFRLVIWADDKRTEPGDVPLKELIHTIHYDISMVSEMEVNYEAFKKVKARVLLLLGSKSASFRKTVINELNKHLPLSHMVQLPGAGHTAANNGQKPLLVANELKKFF